MADPLSLSASIAGIVTLADAVFRTMAKYVKSVKNAASEVEELMREVKNLSVVLHDLSLVAYGLESDDFADESSLPQPATFQAHHIHDCRVVLRRLTQVLEPVDNDIQSQSRLVKVKGRLKWPLSTSETQEMLKVIQRHKQTINLAVSVDSLQKLSSILSRQEEIRSHIVDVAAVVKEFLDIETRIVVDDKKRKVLDFFLKANPRSEFEMSKKLRHHLTGLWLTEGAEFKEWCEGYGNKLWLSGIPGAGKSVLAGAIVEDCLKLTDPKIAAAYFFCTYRSEETHEPSNILSSLASQLARQNEKAYGLLHNYYDELTGHRHLPNAPSTSGLNDLLEKMCGLFDKAFIVVDGLDECGKHTVSAVQTLRQLALRRGCDNLCMALLSRDEIEIRQQLQEDFEHIEIAAHTEDIESYVAWELEDRIRSRKLRLRDVSLKDDILKQLVKGAQGMFRWVACQMDYLCDLPNDKERQAALHKLPPTLNATYERILAKVENAAMASVHVIVQRTLQILSITPELSTKQFLEAVSIPDDGDTFEDDDMVDEHDILRWCSSLIRKSSDDQRFEFAHYSVEEFLRDHCPQHSSLRMYSVSEARGNSLLGQLCLRYLTFKNHERMPEANLSELERIWQRDRSRPFYTHAARWWPTYIRQQQKDEPVSKDLLHLFDLRETPNFRAWALELVRSCFARYSLGQLRPIPPTEDKKFYVGDRVAVQIIAALLQPEFTPLHMASALSLTSLCDALIKGGAKIDQMSRFGTPYHCAIGGLAVFTGDNDRVKGSQYLLESAESARDTVQLLLSSGADKSLHFSTLSLEKRSPLALSITRLRGASYEANENLQITVYLLEGGLTVQEDDLEYFRRWFDSMMEGPRPLHYITHTQLCATVETLMTLVESSGSDAQTRLQMREITRPFMDAADRSRKAQAAAQDLAESADDETIRSFLGAVIMADDTALLRRFLDDRGAESFKTLELTWDGHRCSLLHLAVKLWSMHCLELLLECGFDPDELDDTASTPLHRCFDWTDRSVKRLAYVLLQHNASTTLQDGDGNTIWHLAVHAHDKQLSFLKWLVKNNGADKDHALQMKNNSGRRPIQEAMYRGRREAVKFLLPHYTSDLVLPTLHTSTASYMVSIVWDAIKRQNTERCNELKRLGCPMDIQLPERGYLSNVTPLMAAVRRLKTIKVAEWFLQNGANVSAIFENGPEKVEHHTVLECAVSRPAYDSLLPALVDAYLQQGGNMLEIPRSPLHAAVSSHNSEGLRILLTKLKSYYFEDSKTTDLISGARNETGSETGRTIRSWMGCSSPRSPEIADNDTPRPKSRSFTALINQPDTTALHRTPLHLTAVHNDVKCAQVLLDFSANIEATDEWSNTPLTVALGRGAFDVARLLLRQKASVRATNMHGRSPLWIACCWGSSKSLQLIEIMAENDSLHPLDWKQIDLDGNNLIAAACHNPDSAEWPVFHFLLKRGVDLHQENTTGISAAHHVLAHKSQMDLRIVLQEDPSLIAPSRVKWPSAEIWLATFRRHYAIMPVVKSLRLLRRYFGRQEVQKIVNNSLSGKRSFLHMVVCHNALGAIKDLISMGANIEHEAGDHETPLVEACSRRRFDAVKLLVRNGAVLLYKSGGLWKSAVDAAQGYPEIVDWLLIGRFLDQKKLEDTTHGDQDDSDARLVNWSGIHEIGVPLKWEWEQRRDETRIDYARRRQKIKSDLRGHVVKPLDE